MRIMQETFQKKHIMYLCRRLHWNYATTIHIICTTYFKKEIIKHASLQISVKHWKWHWQTNARLVFLSEKMIFTLNVWNEYVEKSLASMRKKIFAPITVWIVNKTFSFLIFTEPSYPVSFPINLTTLRKIQIDKIIDVVKREPTDEYKWWHKDL